jgi:hypothetical protein
LCRLRGRCPVSQNLHKLPELLPEGCGEAGPFLCASGS